MRAEGRLTIDANTEHDDHLKTYYFHQRPESILKIQGILSEFNEGKKREFYYEAVRGDNRLGVQGIPNHDRPSV